MINPDKFYNVDEFAAFVGVSASTIYHGYSGTKSQLIPQPIKIGRAVRWSGRQIKAFQARIAAESGIDLDAIDVDAAPAPARRVPGRPRKVAAGSAA